MIVVKHEYYCVYESYDKSHTDIAFFSDFDEAQALAQESHYYGVSNRSVSFTIWDTVKEYKEIGLKQSIRQKALAKLTKEEKEILGL